MKRIKLLKNYRGKPSRERVIPAGEYNAKDPRLLKLTDYLVQNGHAVVIEDDNAKSDDGK